MKSCLICDDHTILLEALSATISRLWPDCVIQLARDYLTAWQVATRCFDLCISDLAMPGSDPISGIARLQALQPEMPIIVLTGSHDDQQMIQLLSMGISGFVPKSSTGQVIEAAIRLVLAGGRYLPPEVMNNLTSGSPAQPSINDLPALTRQQRRVLEFLASGRSNKEIAALLGVAPSTIKFHVDGLLERLGAISRTEAVHKGVQFGLLYP